jgi:hypothetical protein
MVTPLPIIVCACATSCLSWWRIILDNAARLCEVISRITLQSVCTESGVQNTFGICVYFKEDKFPISLYRVILKFLCINNTNIFLMVNLRLQLATTGWRKVVTSDSYVTHTSHVRYLGRVCAQRLLNHSAHGSLQGCDAMRSSRWHTQPRRAPSTYLPPREHQLSERPTYFIIHTCRILTCLLNPWRGLESDRL